MYAIRSYYDLRIFGEEPPEAGAVAIMTDTDNTGESAVAFYDDIRLLGGDSAAAGN